MKIRWLALAPVVLTALLLARPFQAAAGVVGRFVQVEGQVDLLKGGKLPAAPAKVEDGVEPGDMVRTKSAARAQIKFVDDTTLTLAPGSRVAIEDYLYDGAKGERRAVVQVYQGLVHALVTRLFNLEKPEFIMKSHTAILGVRGTEWYTAQGPNFTAVYDKAGKISGRSSSLEIPGEVLAPPMTMFLVLTNHPPTLPRPITEGDLRRLEKLMITGLMDLSGAGAPGAGGLPPGPGPLWGVSPSTLPQVPEGLFVVPTLPKPHVRPPDSPGERGPAGGLKGR
jgi:hypothetical protein